jgi:hypothetical protein
MLFNQKLVDPYNSAVVMTSRCTMIQTYGMAVVLIPTTVTLVEIWKEICVNCFMGGKCISVDSCTGGSMIHWPRCAPELFAQGFNIHGCKKVSIFVWNTTHHAIALQDPHKLNMVVNLQVLMTHLNHAATLCFPFSSKTNFR